MEKENTLPWNWREKVLNFLKPDVRLLDLTPGGEFFLRSLSHPAALCTELRQEKELPFPENSFDLILNDGGDCELSEIQRVLKSGGFYLTQQYGGEHLAAFRQRFFPKEVDIKLDYNLENQLPKFREAGFRIMYRNQAYPALRFSDGSQVCEYLMQNSAHFPSLSEQADGIRQQIEAAVAAGGFLELEEHRFIIIAKKR